MLRDASSERLAAAVADALRAVLGEGGGDVHADARLIDDLGLKSLDLASVVARLEMTLDLDAFDSDVAITDVRTVADLTRLLKSAEANK